MEFVAAPKGIQISFDAPEAALMRRLLEELEDVVRGEGPDPVTIRLFPDAYEDQRDQEAYAELVGDQLRKDKLQAMAAVRELIDGDAGITRTVPGTDAESWLPVITDLRLALGTRLNVDEETMARAPGVNDPSAVGLSVLHWLGWMQESLLEALRDLEAKQ